MPLTTMLSNKQNMWYALFKGEKPVYQKDEKGNIVYIEVDGEKIPVETGETEPCYYKPVPFSCTISFGGGESEAKQFGLDESEYSAIVLTDNGEFPIKNDTVFWYETDPNPQELPDGNFDMLPCDYRIVKISPSLGFTNYVLQKSVK